MIASHDSRKRAAVRFIYKHAHMAGGGRAIDASLRTQRDAPIAQERLGRGSGEFPSLIDRIHLAADQLRGHLIGDDADDGELQIVVIAIEAFPGDARVGMHAGDNGVAVGEFQIRANRDAIELDLEGNGFNAHDTRVRHLRDSVGRG